MRKFIWTVHMKNGDKYDVLSKEHEVEKFMLDLLGRNARSNYIAFFSLANTENRKVAIINSQVSSVTWD